MCGGFSRSKFVRPGTFVTDDQITLYGKELPNQASLLNTHVEMMLVVVMLSLLEKQVLLLFSHVLGLLEFHRSHYCLNQMFLVLFIMYRHVFLLYRPDYSLEVQVIGEVNIIQVCSLRYKTLLMT